MKVAGPDRLDVYLDTELVGSVHDTQPLSFEYAPAWLARPDRLGVAAIDLRPGRIDDPGVLAYFDNLLPEGALRDYLSRKHHASTTFALLRAIAGDTAGGLLLLPPGESPGPAEYEVTTWEALAERLGTPGMPAVDIKGGDARISLSGVQDKTSIYIDPGGSPALPRGTSPSSHILKPGIRRLEGVWESAVNEFLIMRTASRCGLPAAEVFYEPHTQACIVRRFDRRTTPDGRLIRLIQYDLCQLDGTVSERKYESEGGPGIVRCSQLIRRYSSKPAVDLRNFLAWIFFNLAVGNNDSHAKNLALLAIPGEGTRLAPFYDLLCTRVYPGLSRKFAFQIGGEDLPGNITREHFAGLAAQLGLRADFVLRVGQAISERLITVLPEIVADASHALSPAARALAARVQREVVHITHGFQRRMGWISP